MDPDRREDEWSPEAAVDEGGGLSGLIDHIQARHHAFMRRELPLLQALLEEAQAQQGSRYSMVFSAVKEQLCLLDSEVKTHLLKEEKRLFPYIRQLEAYASASGLKPAWDERVFHELRHEHEIAADVLERIRRVTGNYALPDDACKPFRALCKSLAAMEADLRKHIGLEENVLLPRALELQRKTIGPAEA